MPAYLTETPEKHEWAISDHPVTSLIVDPSSVRLQAWTLQGMFELRFGVPFLLTPPEGTALEIDPERPQTVAPLLDLIGREVMRVHMTRSGSLVVELETGVRLTVEAHDRFEAWEAEFSGPFGDRGYLCRVGGGSPWG